MRFPLEVVESVRKAIGEDFPILCKINLSDGIKGGLEIGEAVEFAKKLEQAGVDALVLSGGFTSKTPFYLMRGDVPLWEMIKAEKQWQHKAAFAVFGKFIIGKYEFSENFFLPLATTDPPGGEDAAGLPWRGGFGEGRRAGFCMKVLIWLPLAGH